MAHPAVALYEIESLDLSSNKKGGPLNAPSICESKTQQHCSFRSRNNIQIAVSIFANVATCDQLCSSFSVGNKKRLCLLLHIVEVHWDVNDCCFKGFKRFVRDNISKWLAVLWIFSLV